MKLLIVANKQEWKSWPTKIQALVDWFKSSVSLEIDLIHTKFNSVPFVPIKGGNEIDRVWYDTNIHPLAKGYDMVLFSLPTKQWKGGSIRGRWTADKIQEMQLGADEHGTYSYNKIRHSGGKWFNIARHEICHALSKILKINDTTHYWWELGKLDEILKEFRGQDIQKLQHLVLASQLIGTKEEVGEKNNPVILKWAKELGIPYYSDSTAWCSLFINYVCMKSGLPYTKKLNARSWLDVGTKVTTPKAGDIVVLWRNHPDSWEGHVGIYLAGDDKNIAVLGGNQSDAVSTQLYPASRLLGFRRLTR